MVAAYLMYSRNLSPEEALSLIRKARPQVDPNDSFLAQLQIFHKASCRVSMHDKATRMFYLERMVKGIINGEPLDTDVLAAPRATPKESSNGSHQPRQRIRCKMCRQILATRENMQDHGQLSTPSPSVAYSPMVSSPPTFPNQSDVESPVDVLGHHSGPEHTVDSSVIDEAEELGRQLSEKVTLDEARTEQDQLSKDSVPDVDDGKPAATPENKALDTDTPANTFPSMTPRTQAVAAAPSSRPPVARPTRRPVSMSSVPSTAAELSAQLHGNPVLAGLRPELRVTPAPSPSLLAVPRASPNATPAPNSPILVNPKCSGYFVEPLKWMDTFLEKGELSGKIICPNKKCNAKLGNYDWAGLCCGCKEWVVPGFCISRSKVDEVV